MNEQKRKETARFFAERIDTCQAQARLLHADGREDEAVFSKVQANVYNIFNDVFAAAVKASGQDDQKFVQFFLTRLRQIPRNWHTALANAEQHGETQKAHIERVKLDAAAQIQSALTQIWEVAP